MGVVHFRPQHFFLAPSRVDKLDLHLLLILYVHALSVVRISTKISADQLMLFCLAHLSNKFVLQNFTCQHYLSPRAAPFQRHSSGTVHHSKDGGFVLRRVTK